MKTYNLNDKDKKLIKREGSNIIFNLILAVVAIIITATFYKNILLTTIILSIIALIGLIKWKNWLAFWIFIFTGLIGPLVENFAIGYGAWSYGLPNIANVPLWLFILWGIAGSIIFEMAKELKKLGVKDN